MIKIDKKVFEVREIVKRHEEKSVQTMIFQINESGEWVYLAPNAQSHTEEQILEILNKLKELTKGNMGDE